MHSKLYVARLSTEDVSVEELKDHAQSMIEDYPYGSSSVDYIQTMEQLANMSENNCDGEYYRKEFIKGAVDRICKEYYAYRVNENTIKFTKKSMEKYYSHQIDELLKCVSSFKKKVYRNNFWNRIKKLFGFKPEWHWEYDTYGYVGHSYHIRYEILGDEHPKWYSEYTYLYGEGDFIQAIYRKMKFDNLEELDIQIVEVFDYHF